MSTIFFSFATRVLCGTAWSRHCARCGHDIAQVDLEDDASFTFLGLEIERRRSEDLKIHQSQFTKQLLVSYGFDAMTKPMMHVQVTFPTDDDGPPDAAELKTLQKFCGEFNWLATRTRPDISYYVSVIAQGVTKYAT